MRRFPLSLCLLAMLTFAAMQSAVAADPPADDKAAAADQKAAADPVAADDKKTADDKQAAEDKQAAAKKRAKRRADAKKAAAAKSDDEKKPTDAEKAAVKKPADDKKKPTDEKKPADQKPEAKKPDAAKKPAAKKAPDAKKSAVTAVADADADFTYQGEYSGVAFIPGYGQELVGLHVVALGGGKFDAVLYRGGLPGDGWDRQTKQKLSGELADQLVTFQANADRIVIGPSAQTATIVGGSGQLLGRLGKKYRISPTLGATPPPGAVVLFDGKNTDGLSGAKLTDDDLLQAGVLTKMPVRDFRLHLEFRTPYMPQARGQARGNSGVYIQQRYEVQILDSFGLEGVENECGGLYKQTRADVNMCLPPLAWQTYDIYFTAARFADDKKTKLAPARITVLHNGVPVHFHRPIPAKTGGGKAEGPEAFPINLQDHGNPVTFRNIWIVPGQGDESFGGFAGYPYYARY